MNCELNNALHFTIENKSAKLLGRVPCVIQLPFQDYIDKEFNDKSLYNIALAEFGGKWAS